MRSAVLYSGQLRRLRFRSKVIPVNTSDPLHRANVSVSSIAAACEFLRAYWLRFVVISAVLLIPCFWHHHLEAGDLPSHLYNAWLAQLIARGQAPGLFLAHQSNNVLFDFALSGFGNLFGLAAAEKIAISAAVLIFFWGAFALACSISHAASPKPIPWFLAPCIAALTYGYTFEMGFVNYYISIGLAFLGLAVLARSDARPGHSLFPDAIVIFLLIPLIWLAHPLGLFVFGAVGAYIIFAKHLPPARQVYLFSAAVLILLAVHFYIEARHWDIEASVIHGSLAAKFGIMANGADQLLLYAAHDLVPVYLLTALFLASLLVDVAQGWRVLERRQSFLLPLQLYILALLAARFIPAKILVPHRLGTMGALGFLTDRLTSIVAIFACCLLAQIKPRKWHYAGFAVLAAIFFSFLYSETAKISSLEDQVGQLVASLPPGQRVTKKIIKLPGNRISINHIIDRACIGRCFSYDNYEPPSGQFRVRVQLQNPFVMSTLEKVDAVDKGNYVVQESDLPLSVIYECVPGRTDLCLGELTAGQKNGSVGAPRAESATYEPRR